MVQNTNETQSLSTQDNSTEADKESNQRLISILNAILDSLIIIDQHGTIELVNAATEKIFGYSCEELIGQNINLLMPSHLEEKHGQFVSTFMDSGESKIIGTGRKLQAKKSNGKEFPIFLSVCQVYSAQYPQFVGIIRDLSKEEQSRIEIIEVREKLEKVTRLSSMGQLAAGIAHEINQPLTAISSYAQASKNIVMSSEYAEKEILINALDKIVNQAIRANEVISRLRELVRKREAKRQKVFLDHLIHETVSLAKVDTRILDHEIIVELSDNMPPLLHIDPVQIQQVLLNFIGNAIDAMTNVKGMPLIIRTQWLTDKSIEVSVIDSGHGVNASSSGSLFNPFFSTKETGMGMGLSISQTIIHAHGGRIYYAPNLPNGAIFSFSLPVTTSTNQSINKKSEQ